MAPPDRDSLERLSPSELIGVVGELIGEVTRLRAENEKLNSALAKLRVEHQAVKDELARLKHLPPRPPHKPSGMDKGTNAQEPQAGGEKSGRSTRRRGSHLDRLTIDETVIVPAPAPAGSRHKGYDDIVVQDLTDAKTTRYRRERRETPDGRTIVAELAAGIIGGYGPNLHRLCVGASFCRTDDLRAHPRAAQRHGRGDFEAAGRALADGQARDVPRRGRGCARRGPELRPYITVDDTGARHAGKSGYTTQIGSSTFTAFRTGPAKSRLAFLSRLCGRSLYVVNDAALEYMRGRCLSQIAIDKIAGHARRIFSSQAQWERHLNALGLTDLKVAPDPVLIASEGALWGAIPRQGLLADAVIVSDDAGQFRVGRHALCWVHAERLVHKLVPANDKQRNAVVVAKRMVWWFYRCLKEYKLAPSPEQALILRARFDRIFRRRTGYATPDALLKRLHRKKVDLLRVLERPDIPLNTNPSENDIRAVVTKRKISGGTVSEKGRDARDVMLGLAKTCMKLKLSFYLYIGARLGIEGPAIPPLPSLIRPPST
jgi:hypothetical protein